MVFVLSVSFSVTATAQKKEERIVANGIVCIQGENIPGARHNAIQDALRQAVEQGVGMLMDATSVLKNDELMERIYTNTQGYISRYEIIKEGREPGGLYKVKIQAEVSLGVLSDTLVKLGIIKAMMDYPRVMILAHPGEDFSSTSKTGETILIKEFTDKRFDLVDPAKSRELHSEAAELFRVDTIQNTAALVGLKHHAEIVVLYTLKTGNAESDGIMEHAPVTLGTKAVVTTTAQILAAEEQSVTGVGKTPDLARQDGARRAAETISNPMMQTIVSWWNDYTANGTPYILTLRTIPKADSMVFTFQQAVESIPGVVSLTERSSGGGMTEMMVKYKGPSAHFKRAVFDTLHGKNGFEKLHTEASKGRFLVFSVR
jgi:hypothetical protein